MITSVIIAVAVSLLAIVLAIFLYQKFGKSKLTTASLEASRIIEEAKREADNNRKAAEIAAKEHWYGEKLKFEKETASKRKEIEKAEKESLKLDAEFKEGKSNLGELQSRLEKQESELRKETDEQQKKRLDLASGISSLKATIEGKTKEIDIRKENAKSGEKRMHEIDR